MHYTNNWQNDRNSALPVKIGNSCNRWRKAEVDSISAFASSCMIYPLIFILCLQTLHQSFFKLSF